jgi:hypothetical protein
VQRLDPPAEHLGDLGQLLDGRRLDAAFSEELGRAATGDELNIELREPAREVLEPRLVPDRQKRAADQLMSSWTV